MGKKKLAKETRDEIVRLHERGLSAVSIAGSTQARLDRVEEVIMSHDPSYRPPPLLKVWWNAGSGR
jgi:hypothetical protein